jgi:uncharacterized protein (DUF433 family)
MPMNPADSDPALVLRRALEALQTGDWQALLALVDPAELGAIKRQAVSTAKRVGSHVPATPDDFQRREPDLPRAVAEWYAEQERRAVTAEQPAGIRSLGAGSVDELEGLSEGDVFVRWMAATDLSERTRRAYAAIPGVTADEAAAHGHPPRPGRSVVGWVAEGEDTAHVLHRTGKGGWPDLRVESLVRTPAGWRLRAGGIVSEQLRSFFRVIRVPPEHHAMATEQLLARITTDPARCGGHPGIRETGIAVRTVLDVAARGAPPEVIIETHPELERDDILAALLFAASRVDGPPASKG